MFARTYHRGDPPRRASGLGQRDGHAAKATPTVQHGGMIDGTPGVAVCLVLPNAVVGGSS